MTVYLARQIGQALATMFLVSILVFAAGRMIGDPLDLLLPPNASEAQTEAIRTDLGLDRSIVIQYVDFATSALRGDLGESITTRRPVTEMITDALPRSVQLALVSLGMALAIGIPLGVVSAVRRGTAWDYVARMIAVTGQSIPSFVIALVLMLVLAVELNLLPTSGVGSWKHFVLPGVSMAVILAASVTRLMRTSMLEVLEADFIKMHRIKGLPESTVVWKHAVRNAVIAVVSFSAVYLVILITNAVVIETVFSWPGFGRLAYDAVRWRDYPVMQGVVLVGSLLYVVSSLAADAVSALINPRLRVARA